MISLVATQFKKFVQINYKRIVNVLLSIILFAVIILNSGYTLTYLQEDTFAKTLIGVISFLIVFVIFIFTVDLPKTIDAFKKKKPSWCFIAILSLGVSALITMFVSKEINNLISYAQYGIQILCAYLIARLFNLKKFISIYQTGLLIVSLIAISFYVVHFLVGLPLSTRTPFTAFNGSTYFNYFYLSFQNTVGKRVQGPFWEPGLFATFLLLGLSFELVFYKKMRLFYIGVFLITLFLTRSTFGYLLLIFVAFMVITNKTKKFSTTVIFCVIVIAAEILFIFFSEDIIGWLSKTIPAVFGKMQKTDGSIMLIDTDRLQSPVINLQMWLKKPIFGNGISGANILFTEMFPNRSQTSTITFYLAEFGIFGLAFTFFFFFGLWKLPKVEADNKLIFTLLFFVILNKEPHTGIIFDWILLFLFLKEGCDKDGIALAYNKLSENSICSAFLKHDDESTLKKDIALSFIFKGIALIIGFFSYSIYRIYFNNNDVFGVWLTVLSITATIISFDFGLGNGLKNNLIKAIARNDIEEQKKLISSTYLSTFAISLLLVLVLTPLIFTIDLNSLLGLEKSIIKPIILKLSCFAVCFSICFELSIKNITVMLQAKRKQALSSIFPLISTILLIGVALTFKNNNADSSLLFISVAYFFTTNIPLIIGTLIVFLTEYKGCFPKISYLDKKTIRRIVRLGLGFFALQILITLINSTNEFFISNIYGSSYVVYYTNYYKPFSIIAQLFTIITLPYWAIVAKEKEEGKYNEIKKKIKDLFVAFIVFLLLAIFLSVIFQPFINLWLGEGVMTVDYKIVILFDIFMAEWMIAALMSVVANGLSIVRKQALFFGIGASIKITACILLLVFKQLFFKNITNWYLIIIFSIAAYIPIIIGEAIILITTFKNLNKEDLLKNEKDE